MSLEVKNKRLLLLNKLRTKSVFFGDFLLSSGVKSHYYIDCKLTTLDSEGACLVGDVMHELILTEIERSPIDVYAVGGLTMGADPIALAVGMISWQKNTNSVLQVFSVRKSPKAHGQNKLVEGSFMPGTNVVVIDDVVTRGDSTLKAIEAIEQSGANVAFVAVLVDRGEGGCDKIRSKGYTVISAFNRNDLTSENAGKQQKEAFASH